MSKQVKGTIRVEHVLERWTKERYRIVIDVAGPLSKDGRVAIPVDQLLTHAQDMGSAALEALGEELRSTKRLCGPEVSWAALTGEMRVISYEVGDEPTDDPDLHFTANKHGGLTFDSGRLFDALNQLLRLQDVVDEVVDGDEN